MKDLSLSLLSRGCGRFVSSNTNSGREDGRLDVCFTPQDYYIWKSQDSLLRMSNSGRLLMETESALPKTYSTRRGPLLLYSQDLVTVETSCQSETRNRKQRVVRRYTQQVQQQLRTLKELSAAILSYSNTHRPGCPFSSSRLGPLLFPPLHLPHAQDLHPPSLPPLHGTQEQSSPELPVLLNPQWLPADRNTEQLKEQHKDNEEEHGCRKRIRLDLFLQIPCASRTPTPQREPQPTVHCVAMTPEPEEPQTCVDVSRQRTESSPHTEIKHHSMGGAHHHPNIDMVCDVAYSQESDVQDNGATSDEGNYKRSRSGNRHGRIGLLPPLTVGDSVSNRPRWEKTDKMRWEALSSDRHHTLHLPPIAESCVVGPGLASQAQIQEDVQLKTGRAVIQPQENMNRLNQQPLFLPLMFPGKEEEIRGKQGGGAEKTERQHYKKETVQQRGGGQGLPSEKGSMILLEPGEDPPPPPVGALGCVVGRKGPGKQSSLAFLQNRLLDLQDPCKSSDANRGMVRGILPLELRDLQDGKPVGSLILGPDGEIIQLSMYDQDPPDTDGDTQEQALQVLSAEGEKLPWVIVLQPEHSHTEDKVELDTDVPVDDTQHHQSIGLHKLIEIHRSPEATDLSPSSHTEPAAVTKKPPRGAVEVVETLGKNAKSKIRMPPLREQAGKEELSGGNAEAEEDEEEQQTNHLSGSHQSGQQSIVPNEPTTEDTVDKRMENTKRTDSEEAAPTTGEREMKPVDSAAPDGQKTRTRTDKRRQKTGSAIEPIRRQKQEEQISKEAAATQSHSALPSVKKSTTDRERGRGEVRVNEGREERGEVAKKEESAGRMKRRKGRGSQRIHKELVVGNHEDRLEKEEVEISQEIPIKSPSATPQPDKNKTKTNSEEDTEQISSNADEHSSERSVSSLQSAAASSKFNQRSSRRSAASSCEGIVLPSSMGLASSRGRLSSSSTVMVTEEQLMLNPVKPESSMHRETQEEAAAQRLAQRAEKRRQEVERRRMEREEEERKQQEREQTVKKMESELEGERRKRAEDLRLKKLAEEKEREKREEEEQQRARREQEQRERERRRQEERRRQMERLQKMREEEEKRKNAELQRQRLEEERRQEEENKKLQQMDEGEREEYLCRKEQEEEDRRKKEEERKRGEEEAALRDEEEARMQAELLARQVELLQQQLAFKRGLMLEAGGLEKTQGISRPWIYSYFTLLQLLGLNPTKAKASASDL